MESYYFDYITSFGIQKDLIAVKKLKEELRIVIVTDDFTGEANLTLEAIQKEIEKKGLTQIERDNLIPTLLNAVKEGNFTFEYSEISFHLKFSSAIEFSLSFTISTPVTQPYFLKRLILEYSADPILLSKKREQVLDSAPKTNKCLVNPRMRRERKTKGIKK